MHTSLIAQFCSTLAQWQWPLFGLIRQLQPTQQLVNISQANGMITVVSEASVQKDKNSGFAWVIAHHEWTLWRGVGLAPGHEDDIYLGRAEAFGLLASLTFLQHYIQRYGCHLFPESPLQCFCDNLGLITTITDMMTPMIIRPNNAMNNDHDIMLAICQMAKACKLLQPTFLHSRVGDSKVYSSVNVSMTRILPILEHY